jgi:hypothetical protein
MSVPTLMGLAFAALGAFGMSMSGPLASWATNMNLFLRAEQRPAYRERKRRRIRVMAGTFLILAAGILLFALVVELMT